jgi:hypothetical protein
VRYHEEVMSALQAEEDALKEQLEGLGQAERVLADRADEMQRQVQAGRGGGWGSSSISSRQLASHEAFSVDHIVRTKAAIAAGAEVQRDMQAGGGSLRNSLNASHDSLSGISELGGGMKIGMDRLTATAAADDGEEEAMAGGGMSWSYGKDAGAPLPAHTHSSAHGRPPLPPPPHPSGSGASSSSPKDALDAAVADLLLRARPASASAPAPSTAVPVTVTDKENLGRNMVLPPAATGSAVVDAAGKSRGKGASPAAVPTASRNRGRLGVVAGAGEGKTTKMAQRKPPSSSASPSPSPLHKHSDKKQQKQPRTAPSWSPLLRPETSMGTRKKAKSLKESGGTLLPTSLGARSGATELLFASSSVSAQVLTDDYYGQPQYQQHGQQAAPDHRHNRHRPSAGGGGMAFSEDVDEVDDQIDALSQKIRSRLAAL